MKLVHDLPIGQYHNDFEHVSNTMLGKIDRSPAHLKAYMDGFSFDTDSFKIGRLIHCLVLEPETFASEYVVAPKVDRRTNAGKAEWEQFLLTAEGKSHVSAEDLATAKAVREAVYKHKAARALLELPGSNEVSCFWNNEETGVPCRARADKLAGSIVIDLKSTQDAGMQEFAKSIARYRYHVQAKHYSEGFQAEQFCFIACEKTPPYGVAVYWLSTYDIERAADVRRANLELFAQCKASGEWPGYPETIQQINLPAWA